MTFLKLLVFILLLNSSREFVVLNSVLDSVLNVTHKLKIQLDINSNNYSKNVINENEKIYESVTSDNRNCCEHINTNSQKVIKTRSVSQKEDHQSFKNSQNSITNPRKKEYNKDKFVSFNINNKDPAIYMTVPELIALHGYRSESHNIVTDDGYILTVHRIPLPKSASTNTSSSKAVLIHHGLLGSSADWIIAGPEKGLPYILSEAGYDVWLANARGNTYSRAHVRLSVDSAAFWNYTFNEIGQYDLPAVIDYIKSTKGDNSSISYIGHSMGATVLFVLLSTKTEYNNILHAGIGLAPVAFLTNVRTPLKFLTSNLNILDFTLKALNLNELFSSNSFYKRIRNYFCESSGYLVTLCEYSLYLLCGFDEKQFNRSLLPILFNNVPAGVSSKLMMHYAQEYYLANGRFQMFDYGSKGNILEYGDRKPPQYPVQNITLPIMLISGKNDLLVSKEDVEKLYKLLPHAVEHYIVNLNEFSHIDFLWAIDAPSLLYNKVLSFLESSYA